MYHGLIACTAPQILNIWLQVLNFFIIGYALRIFVLLYNYKKMCIRKKKVQNALNMSIIIVLCCNHYWVWCGLDLTSYDVIIFFIIKLFVNITSSDVKLNSHFIFLKKDIYSRLVLLC